MLYSYIFKKVYFKRSTNWFETSVDFNSQGRVFRNRESSWLAPSPVITWEISWTKSETLFVNIQGNVTNAICKRTCQVDLPLILVSVMVPYTFANTTIFIASVQIIQNWNAPLIWSNYLSLSLSIQIYQSNVVGNMQYYWKNSCLSVM